MALSTPVNLVKVQILSSGTGAFALGVADAAFRGIEALSDGATYSYTVQQGAQFEIGQGVYVSSGPSLTRTPTVSSNGGTVVDFSAGAFLSFTYTAEDIQAYFDASVATLIDYIQATTDVGDGPSPGSDILYRSSGILRLDN